MKTYWLTCAQMPWRNAEMAAKLAAAGVEAERFDGIHGATAGLSPPCIAHFDSPTHRINGGKLAITASKALLWTMLLERADDPVFLLENDVVFCPDFRQELAASFAALPDDWDVAHVGHCCIDDKPTRRINDRISEIRHPLCCHAVLWRKRALAVALAELKRASWGTHSDCLLAQAVYPKLRHYSFTPPLVFPDKSYSEAAAVHRWSDIQGWFDFSPLYDDALRGVTTEPATFVEVGSWLGRSTAYLAEEIKRMMKPVKFFAVDTWKGNLDEPAMALTIAQHHGDLFPQWQKNMSRAGVLDYVTPIQKTSVEAAKDFADGSCRFVFIDAGHDFDSVVSDIRAWRPKVKGMLAGHDIDRESVRRAVEQEFGRSWRRWERCWIVD